MKDTSHVKMIGEWFQDVASYAVGFVGSKSKPMFGALHISYSVGEHNSEVILEADSNYDMIPLSLSRMTDRPNRITETCEMV
jgi:hypothetical protein